MATRRTVTITDVSKRVGCSISTVSAALNGTPGVSPQLRRTILRTARQMGYQPNESARRLRRSRPRLIGVSHVMGQSFQTLLLDGVYDAARETAYDVMLAAVTPHHGAEACLKTLIDNRCEGLILIGSTSEPELVADVARRLPVVAFSYEAQVPGLEVVNSRDELGIDLLMAHIIETGRHRIWYVDGRSSPQSRPRASAYRRAMARNGLADQARLIPGGSDAHAGIAAARTVLAATEPPEALLAYNDDLAFGMLMELRRQGIAVPERVALAGFDDAPLAAAPGIDLTTVRQDAPTMARAAVARLIERLGGPEEQVRRLADPGQWETVERPGGAETRVEPTLIRRESTSGRS